MLRIENPHAVLVGMQIGVATVENSMELPQKIKNGSASFTNLKEHKHPYVHCSIIYNHQDMEAAQVSINK